MNGYLTLSEVVALLPVSRATFFRSVRHDPTFPPARMIGAKPFWREDQVREWLA